MSYLKILNSKVNDTKSCQDKVLEHKCFSYYYEDSLINQNTEVLFVGTASPDKEMESVCGKKHGFYHLSNNFYGFIGKWFDDKKAPALLKNLTDKKKIVENIMLTLNEFRIGFTDTLLSYSSHPKRNNIYGYKDDELDDFVLNENIFKKAPNLKLVICLSTNAYLTLQVILNKISINQTKKPDIIVAPYFAQGPSHDLMLSYIKRHLKETGYSHSDWLNN